MYNFLSFLCDSTIPNIAFLVMAFHVFVAYFYDLQTAKLSDKAYQREIGYLQSELSEYKALYLSINGY